MLLFLCPNANKPNYLVIINHDIYPRKPDFDNTSYCRQNCMILLHLFIKMSEKCPTSKSQSKLGSRN
jgi:hypothetical protein